jgi:hypothetical protein
MRKARRFRRRARRTGIAALVAAVVAVAGGCGFMNTPNGTIIEVEDGVNGTKIEYHHADAESDGEDGEQSREVYLVRNSGCREDMRIQDCAQPHELLAAREKPGTGLDVFTACADADALASAPLRPGDPGWNAKLDTDRDGQACE